MTAQALLDTAGELLAGDRGILAMDESIATCNRRFAAVGIEQETAGQRPYRELLVSTPRLADSITARSCTTRRSDGASTTAGR